MRLTQSRSETLAWLCLLFALCGGVVWVRTATVKATYRYVQQEKEMTVIKQEIQGLRIRWLKLTSPKRLEALAQQMQLSPLQASQRVQYAAKGAIN